MSAVVKSAYDIVHKWSRPVNAKTPRPPLTPGELELMEMLWREKAVTLAQAHAALDRRIGYTTVQTRLNRLVAKGLAERSPQRPAVYRAAVQPAEVGAGHLDLLVRRLGAESVVPLVAHLVRDRKLGAEEIAALKRLLAEAEAESAGRQKTT